MHCTRVLLLSFEAENDRVAKMIPGAMSMIGDTRTPRSAIFWNFADLPSTSHVNASPRAVQLNSAVDHREAMTGVGGLMTPANKINQ